MMGFGVHVCVAGNCEKLLNIYLTCSHTHCNLSASYTAASYIPAITSNATHGGFIYRTLPYNLQCMPSVHNVQFKIGPVSFPNGK